MIYGGGLGSEIPSSAASRPRLAQERWKEESKRTGSVPKVHNEASEYDYICDKVQPIWFVSLGIG